MLGRLRWCPVLDETLDNRSVDRLFSVPKEKAQNVVAVDDLIIPVSLMPFATFLRLPPVCQVRDVYLKSRCVLYDVFIAR